MPRRCPDVPTLLTLSRLLMAGGVWFAPSSPALLLALMAAAAVSDMLDGWLARRLGSAGGAGVWLDPLCDKVFVLSALAAVWVARRPPLWVLPVIGARELLQAFTWLIFRKRHRFEFRAALIGKLATVLQFAAVALILLGGPGVIPVSLAAGVAGTVAALYYGTRSCASGS